MKAAQSRYAEEELALLEALLREGTHAGEFAAHEPGLLACAILRAYVSFSPPSLFTIPRDEVARRSKPCIGSSWAVSSRDAATRHPPLDATVNGFSFCSSVHRSKGQAALRR